MFLTREQLRSAVEFSKAPRLWRFVRHPKRELTTLAARLACRFWRSTFRVSARTFWGQPMEVILPEGVSVSLFRYGFFEEGLSSIVIALLESGGVFFDIGSHFGYYTLMASKLVGPSGRVIAFEPTPSTFNILQRNVRGLPNVTPLRIALYDRKQQLTISDFGPEFSGFNSLFEPRLSSDVQARLRRVQQTVDALSVDEVVSQNRKPPTFVKIDAESAELKILHGMGRTLAEQRPLVTVEVGDIGVPGAAPSRSLVDFMLGRDYVAFEFSSGRIKPHVPKDQYEYTNLLFAPKGAAEARVVNLANADA